MTSVKCSLKLWCLAAAALIAGGQHSPMSPCPEIFTYEYDGQHWYGKIKTHSSDLGSEAMLSVKMFLGTPLQSKYSGSIEPMEHKSDLMNEKSKSFNYKVNFPESHVIPKVIHIILNGKQICSGDSEERFEADENVIDISLHHVTRTNYEDLNDITSDHISADQKSHVFRAPLVHSRPQILKRQQMPPYEHNIIEGDDNNGAYHAFDNQLMNVRQTNYSFQTPQDTQFQEHNYFTDSTMQSIPSLIIKNEHFETDNLLRRKRAPEDWLDFAKILRPSRDRSTITSSLSTRSGGARTADDDKEVNDFINSLPSRPYKPASRPDVVGQRGGNTDSTSFECGIGSPAKLFVHGNVTFKGNWPWLVAVLRTAGSDPQFYCGSTLISDRHVITAAHCTRTGTNIPLSRSDLVVLVGAFNIINWRNDPDVQQTGVSEIKQHSSYVGSPNTFNDIAILVLDKKINFNNNVKPICLWTFDTDEKYLFRGTVVGWGRDENGQRFTPEPREGQVPIVSLQTCRGSRQEYFQFTSDTTICAGAKNGVGPCNGDSGGGLYIAQQNKWYLRGIVSVSFPSADFSCNLREYVVFTDAAKFRSWIEDIMRNS